MNPPPFEISTDYQRKRLQEFTDLIAWRNERCIQIESGYQTARNQRETEYQQQRQEKELRHHTMFSTLQGEYLQNLEAARTRFESASEQLQSERKDGLQRADDELTRSRRDGEANWEQTRAIALQDFETDQQHAKDANDRLAAAVASSRQQLDWLLQRVGKRMQRRGVQLSSEAIPPTDPEISSTQLIQHYSIAAQTAHDELMRLANQPLVRFVDEGWPILLFLFLGAAVGVPWGMAAGWSGWQWLIGTIVTASVVAAALRWLAEQWIRRHCTSQAQRIRSALREAQVALQHADEMVPVEARRRTRDLEKRKNQQLRQADETWNTILTELQSEHHTLAAATNQLYEQQWKSVQRTWDIEAASCRQKYVPRIERSQKNHALELEKMAAEHDGQLRELEDLRATQWNELIEQWHRGANALAQDSRRMLSYCEENFPDWHAIAEFPSNADLPAVPFGQFRTELAAIPHGPPDDPRLQIEWTHLDWPAVLSFPQSPSLLITTEGEGRGPAIHVLQACMLRLLTSFPPGKVRFTIFDPTGLGENFSTFMHLSDFDERLVNNRIWTEVGHIQQRLADLTEHMENVIQKYLRNEFSSIQEYNRRAGEIAEPFQILVIANFPANFSDEAARRLVSIASSGARCGVYFLISVDRRMKLPMNFDLQDLHGTANRIEWQGDRFRWQTDDLASFPLTVTGPPEGELATELVKETGRRAKVANRVEVPFAAVAPTDSAWWQADSSNQVEVPLGRAGATQLQYLTLGPGTSQHVLVAGKTGSGKSTLLNAMITNLALHYSPEQLQFYLVDFKKGVEFKAYAQYRLPHARVVAIESEREFGMSVLERLDAELHDRGELFRGAGVQNLAGFRNARPDVVMPRLLLIIDEFQEFFVKDDKIAQEAALLLDRLVRQGRAFGIHVLLGSQTLAGAYTLARSTLGQMAVRIALQCSESDAHLILSEENTAARLLNRPGEAIYNNANGRFEGNNPFQVVWLPDDEREHYLRRLDAYARSQRVPLDPPVVFEGNVAADLAENSQLLLAWQSPPTDPAGIVNRAWLGAPIAIKDPTSIDLRRQAGAHLVIVGQQESLALGVTTSVILSLASCQPCRSNTNGSNALRAARIVVLDGGTLDAEHTTLSNSLSRWPGVDITTADPGTVMHALSEIGEELARRLAEPEQHRRAEPIFLVIFNLARFRDLRAAEDDFGLDSFSDGPAATPAAILRQVLRDGSSVGIHCVIWCDSYNNLTRWLSRQMLRDIAYRVLFQMSAGDSSNLMDSTSASQLGSHRAILYDDERGEFERFRPYSADLDNMRRRVQMESRQS